MSNIQVMALGNMVGDDIMVQTTSLDIEDNRQEIGGASRWMTVVPMWICTLPMKRVTTTPCR